MRSILRTHKYGARKVILDGYMFDSKAEVKRYQELKLLWAAGQIWILEIHPTFVIRIKGKQICRVILDFAYCNPKGRVIEDVKGMDTPISRLKRKLVEAQYGIKVEVLKR